MAPTRQIASLLAVLAGAVLFADCGRAQLKIKFRSRHCDVWTQSATLRTLRAGLPGTSRTVELGAARNEWESFQILMRSDLPLVGVDLFPGDLVGPGGAVIAAGDAVLYRQHQFEITSPSWGVTSFTPGWYPDALIPFCNPITGERFTDPNNLLAAPFDLPPDETHGFLVDLHVPVGAPAGVYSGSYQLRAGPGFLGDIPVSLTVWNFDLPDVPTLRTDFGAPEHQIRHLAWLNGETHSEAWWQAVADQCNELLSRHRLNATLKAYTIYFTANDLQPDGSFTLPGAWLNTIQAFLDAQPLNAVRLPFRGTPTVKEVTFGSAWYDENTYQPGDLTTTRRDRLLAYLGSWDQVIASMTGIQDVFFYVYLCDEPNTAAAYAYVRELGTAIRGAGFQHIEVLVVEQTTPDVTAWGDLYGAIDTWVPYFLSFDPVSAAARRALGEEIWTYTAMTSWGGGMSWQTDLPLINHRIPTWVAWRHEMCGLLYWSMAYWWGPNYADPWSIAHTYENTWMGNTYDYNGDGVLVYPGDQVGYDGIAPSLRLKAIRDAVEDFEYLTIADALGRRQQALAIVTPLADSFASFVDDPEAYEQARRDLAALIQR